MSTKSRIGFIALPIIGGIIGAFIGRGIEVFASKYKKSNLQYCPFGIERTKLIRYMLAGNKHKHITPPEVKRKVDSANDDFVILDVRSKRAYDEGHIKGARALSFGDLIAGESIEIDKEKDIIVTCYLGGLSRAAISILAERGFTKLFNMYGGMGAWDYEKEKSNGAQ
jgi:rhodanese-related sulfurtransferase